MTINWDLLPPALLTQLYTLSVMGVWTGGLWAGYYRAAPAHEIHRVTTAGAGARVGHRSPQSQSRRWAPGTDHRHLWHYGLASSRAQGPLSLSSVRMILMISRIGWRLVRVTLCDDCLVTGLRPSRLRWGEAHGRRCLAAGWCLRPGEDTVASWDDVGSHTCVHGTHPPLARHPPPPGPNGLSKGSVYTVYTVYIMHAGIDNG